VRISLTALMRTECAIDESSVFHWVFWCVRRWCALFHWKTWCQIFALNCGNWEHPVYLCCDWPQPFTAAA